jgi:hypothetical protein
MTETLANGLAANLHLQLKHEVDLKRVVDDLRFPEF